MTHPSHDPLTPQERELAARLARLGPHGEPPAALDARILAAAHAAVATSPHAHRRWPALLAVAATLALAIGLTWQLRPHDDAAPVLHEGPAASAEMEAAPAASADAVPAEAATAAAVPADAAAASATDSARSAPPASAPGSAPLPTPPSAPTAQAQSQSRPSTRASRTSAPVTGTAALRAAPPPEGQATQEEPLAMQPSEEAAAPARVMASPPPPPPAPVAAPAAVATPQAATAAPMMRKAMPQPVAADSAAEAALPRINGRAVSDVPIEDDARLDATDWLDRIRLRQLADDTSGARASLALFRRYYPDRAIPEDLAPLAH
ncbi:hypothetical protein [Lysobacter olei]